MKRIILALFIIFMIGFLVLEMATVVSLVKDKQPPLIWIDERN